MRLIDADALKNEFTVNGTVDVYGRQILYSIDGMPTVDAVPVVHAHWDLDDEYLDGAGYGLRCSSCKEVWFYRFDYCPHCGAKMDGGDASGS